MRAFVQWVGVSASVADRGRREGQRVNSGPTWIHQRRDSHLQGARAAARHDNVLRWRGTARRHARSSQLSRSRARAHIGRQRRHAGQAVALRDGRPRLQRASGVSVAVHLVRAAHNVAPASTEARLPDARLGRKRRPPPTTTRRRPVTRTHVSFSESVRTITSGVRRLPKIVGSPAHRARPQRRTLVRRHVVPRTRTRATTAQRVAAATSTKYVSTRGEHSGQGRQASTHQATAG